MKFTWLETESEGVCNTGVVSADSAPVRSVANGDVGVALKSSSSENCWRSDVEATGAGSSPRRRSASITISRELKCGQLVIGLQKLLKKCANLITRGFRIGEYLNRGKFLPNLHQKHTGHETNDSAIHIV